MRYYPEYNGLILLWHYAEGSKAPAAKSIPVRLFKDADLDQLIDVTTAGVWDEIENDQ